MNAAAKSKANQMPSLVIRCPICGKTPRYALPSQQRIARTPDGKAILNDGEPIVEMAYRCRGGDVFFHAKNPIKVDLSTASKDFVSQVLVELDKVKKEREKKEAE